MNHILLTLRSALTAVALVSAPVLASAQSSLPSREGNIWDGTAHDPEPSRVIPKERADGVALPPGQRRAVTDQVEDLYRKLEAGSGSAAKQ